MLLSLQVQGPGAVFQSLGGKGGMCKKKRLLLVDDEQVILDSLGRDLEEEHFVVTKAVCGEDAIDILETTHFDCIITDLVMPGVDGFQVLKAAKKRQSQVIVIILTGFGDMTSAVDALRLGADDFLQKPCTTEEILFRIANCITRRELQQKLILYESLLPVCSYCKRIRDDRGKEKGQGKWLSMEEYFWETGDISFSHGCCQECYEKLMKGMDAEEASRTD